jgi:hypothetical protein
MDAFDYLFEILKKELDAIVRSIRKLDDLGSNIRNWTVLICMGSVALFLGDSSLRPCIVLTAFPPLLLMTVDESWGKIQRRFVFRQNRIDDYLNSSELDENVKLRVLQFELLDPIARNDL